MAVPGNAYPAVQLDARGEVVDSGIVVQFTDDSDQPGAGAATPPFHAAPTGTTAIIVDSPDGDPIIEFDADTNEIKSFYNWNFGSTTLTISTIDATTVNAASLGPTQFVLVQGGPPDPIDTYVTPLIFDSTAVSGGLYAFDGTQYQQVGGPLA